MDEAPQRFSPRDLADIGRMLRAYRAGHFARRPERRGITEYTSDSVTVRITGHASGGGKYNAKLVVRSTDDVSESGDLAASDIGVEYTPPSSDIKILALNLNEIAMDTHAIDVHATCLATVLRQQSDGTTVVLINAAGYYDCEEDSEEEDGGDE